MNEKTKITLADIKEGEASVSQARQLLQQMFDNDSEVPSEDIYFALRGFVWNALEQGRRDGELRDWQDIIRDAAFFISAENISIANKLVGLGELLFESSRIAQIIDPAELVQNKAIRLIMKFMAEQDGWIGKANMATGMGIPPDQLNTVLKVISYARFMEQKITGDGAVYRLSKLGLEMVESFPAMEMSPVRLSKAGLLATCCPLAIQTGFSASP